MNWYIGILIGIGAAVVRIGLGWLRSAEVWNTEKGLRTLGIGVAEGALVGAFAGLGAKETFAAVFLGTVAVEEVLVGLSRLAKA